MTRFGGGDLRSAALPGAMTAMTIIALAIVPPSGRADAPSATLTCVEQEPQSFLVRSNFVRRGRISAEERRVRERTHARAIEYRTVEYGRFPGFGDAALNPHPPMHYAQSIELWGRRVRLHRRIIPAVRCAAADIARTCSATPYTPARLSGIRDRNTYRGGEVSNHVYGIALDIDPHRNTCCGCVAPWNEAPLCADRSGPIWSRMAMPECWVHAFERYGFYWLGRDQLEDTMHFEFLGDPDRLEAN